MLPTLTTDSMLPNFAMLSSSTFSQGSWSRSTGLLIIGGHPMGKIPASSSEDSSSKGVCWYLSKDGQFLMFLWWYTCIWGTLCLSRFWFWGGNIPDCSNLVHSWLICPCSCLCCCCKFSRSSLVAILPAAPWLITGCLLVQHLLMQPLTRNKHRFDTTWCKWHPQIKKPSK